MCTSCASVAVPIKFYTSLTYTLCCMLFFISGICTCLTYIYMKDGLLYNYDCITVGNVKLTYY